MKKPLLILLVLVVIGFSYGCKPKFWPNKDEASEVSSTQDEEIAKEDESTTEKPDKKKPAEKEIIPDQETPTTGKIFTPSPEGIRPENATPPSTKSDGVKFSHSSDIREARYNPNIEREAVRKIITLSVKVLVPKHTYWYECDYYGNCWDSESYSWYNCYYNAYATTCSEGNFWQKGGYWQECDEHGNCRDSNGYNWYNPREDTNAAPQATEPITSIAACCDTLGNCYDENENWYPDPLYLTTDYCDECGNCYDYYGNYVQYDPESVNEDYCSQYYYQYDKVSDWDTCGNATDTQGNYLFYDNNYYDYQACNEDYSACDNQSLGEPDSENTEDCDTLGNCWDENNDWYADPIYLEVDYCDECGNCYDYYGNYVQHSPSAVDEYWCSQYYQYDKTSFWDECGNGYDVNGNFLFYDNDHYDYRTCNKDGLR